MHETTYFKGQGRQEQEGKKNDSKNQRKQRKQKLLQKFCEHKDFFFLHGRGAIGIDATRYMFSRVLLMQYKPWNIMFLTYFTYKNLSKCHRKVIPASRYKQNQILWEIIHNYFWISFLGSLCLFLDITLLYSNLPDFRRNLSFTVIYLLYWQLHCQFIFHLM